jgi:hypothetical protein
MPEPGKGSLSFLDRFVRFICEEGQKRLGEPRQIPERDPRLVREGVSAVAPDAAKTRMEAVQSRAGTPTSISDTLFFSKIKSWLVSTKQTEATGCTGLLHVAES